jgi:hypothetical protein
MTPPTAAIERLLKAIRDDDRAKPAFDRAYRRYRNDCGCALGAKSLILSIIAYVAYLATPLSPSEFPTHLVRTIVLGVLFVLFSTVTGKLVGIKIARWRLRLLHRSLVEYTCGAHAHVQ